MSDYAVTLNLITVVVVATAATIVAGLLAGASVYCVHRVGLLVSTICASVAEYRRNQAWWRLYAADAERVMCADTAQLHD